MQPQFSHVRPPRRARFYLAGGAGLVLWQLLLSWGGPPPAFIGLALYIAAMLALAIRAAAVGLEIRDGCWNVFAGRQSWSVPLGDIGAVGVIGARSRPRGLWLRLRDGRVLRLPAALKPDLRALEHALAWRGIPVEA